MLPPSERAAVARVFRPAALAALSLLGAASAQSGQWRAVATTTAPPVRSGFTFVEWDDGELLLFGGDLSNPAATEWSWDGIGWRPVTTPVPRRREHAMAQNPVTGGLLLFGGRDAGATQLTDTWSYQNGSWSQLLPTVTPPPLVDPRLAYDPADQSMLMVANGPPGQDVWRYQNDDWSPVPSATLPAGFRTVFTDSVRGEANVAVAAGGVTEIYRFDGSGWVLVGSSSLPFGAIATFDRDRGRAVLVQGAATTLTTAEFDGLGFASFGSTIVPSANLPLLALAYHSLRRETVALRGNVAPASSTIDVLRWAPAPTPQAVAHGAACQDPTFELRLVAGDSPQPGAGHRLEAVGQSGSFVTLVVFGFSHVEFGGLPLPQPIPLGALGCQLRVEAAIVGVLGLGLPQTRLVTLPNSAALLGERYDAQCLQFDATGVLDSSNGLELQIGLPLPENQLVETFASSANRDPVASGDSWAQGLVLPASIGGDGRHGSFDATFGLQTAPGVYEWNTDNQLIPASATLDGQPAFVADGRFYFTDLTVPAGTTVRFVGNSPVQLFVRGRVDVQGTISVDAADMPFALPTLGPAAGQRVSTFDARGPGGTLRPGQPGGQGGPGGGSGGNGGDECNNTGPVVIGGVNFNDGRPGDDVRVSAAHAYLGATGGTGGSGSLMEPAAGVSPNLPSSQLITNIYLPFFSPGGGGGGHSLAGAQAALPTLAGPTPLILAPQAGGGQAFPLLPYPASPPPGYSSLEHFGAGGSGGGGGGSHGFGLFGFASASERWMAGHGGSGGGGALALRAGADVLVAGALTARGGRGVLVNGDDPASPAINAVFGISSPGGGGSGGTVLLQGAADVVVGGQLDTSGGDGSRNDLIVISQLQLLASAGAGSAGYYRLEAGGSAGFTGTGVPAYSAAANLGPLNDRDDRTGSRSRWLLPAASGLPVYLRYELLVAINGVPVLFSDDAKVSPLAADDPTGAALLRFQGARRNALTGQPIAGSEGPWRTTLRPGSSSLNRDRAETLRFDLVLDKSVGQVQVLELRLIWR